MENPCSLVPTPKNSRPIGPCNAKLTLGQAAIMWTRSGLAMPLPSQKAATASAAAIGRLQGHMSFGAVGLQWAVLGSFIQSSIPSMQAMPEHCNSRSKQAQQALIHSGQMQARAERGARFSKALTQAGQGGGAAVRGVGHQALVHLLAAHTQALQARVWKGSAGFSGAELGRETAGYCRTNCQKSQASGPLARTQVWQANKTGRHKRRRQAYQPS